MGTIYQFTLDTIYSAYENIKNTICCWWCKLVYSSLIFNVSHETKQLKKSSKKTW